MLAQPPCSRSEILQAAIVLFARKGYAGTGVQEILDSVQLSKPTLYYHFESKAGLFRAILDHAYEESYRLLDSAVASASSLEEKLVAAADSLFQFTSANQNLTRLVFGTVFAAPEEIPPDSLNPVRRRKNLEVVETVLQAAQRAGTLDRGYSVRDLAHGIFGAISHRIRTFLLTGEGELNRNTAETVVALFLNGARAR